MPALVTRPTPNHPPDDFCGDPFLLWQTVAETMAHLPPDLKAVVVQLMAGSDRADVREAAVLGLLDGEPEVRLETVTGLMEGVDQIGADALHRIETLLPWLPAEEQSAVDTLAQTVRDRGVVPAPRWTAATVDFFASPMDSTGAVSLFALVPADRQARLASVLARRDAGILDAVLSEPMGGSRAKRMVSEAGRQMPIAPVSPTFIRRWIGDLLAVHQSRGTVPPQGLLQVAEAIGVRDWVPLAVDWCRRSEELVAALSPRMVEPAGIAQVIAASAAWAKRSGLTDGWMEEDEEARAAIMAKRDTAGPNLAAAAMAEVLEPRRRQWAELCVRAADWLREAYGDSGPWGEFALLGREMVTGRPLVQIPLMQTVAARTALAAEWASGYAAFSPSAATD